MGRTKAPELIGSGGWIGTTEPLSLAALRGKVVVLHFWTLSNALCHQVIEDLRSIEDHFAERVVVVGVHSPKFPHEGEHDNVREAVARHRIRHPVLDDPDLVTWQQYGVKGWPTLAVIDPLGYVVGVINGAGHRDLLERVVTDTVDEHLALSTIRMGRLPLRSPVPPPGLLAYPTKVATNWRGGLAIADSGNDRVLVVDQTDPTVRPPRSSSGPSRLRGRLTHVVTGLSRPQGVCFDGDALVICDTGANRLLRVPLDHEPDESGLVRIRPQHDHIVRAGMSSPTAVIVDFDGTYVVAEATSNQLWRVDPDRLAVGPVAGSGQPGLADGRARSAELAQPSGLSRLPHCIAFTDADSSAVRLLTNTGRVATLAGLGLYDWGARDGRGLRALLQHPNDVAGSPDGSTIWVADTFNSRIRRWRAGRLDTVELTTDLAEPRGIEHLGGGRLAIADTNNHRILICHEDGLAYELDIELRPVASVAARPKMGDPVIASVGAPMTIYFDVDVDEGFYLDPAKPAPVRVTVEAEPSWLIDEYAHLAWENATAEGAVTIGAGVAGRGMLTVAVDADVCGDGVVTIARSIRHHPLVIEATDLN